MEFLDGVLRLSLPLCCLSLAAAMLARVGIWNISLDGQVLLAAIVYLNGAGIGSWKLGFLTALLVIIIVNYFLINLVTLRKLDGLLISLGLLYACQGLSQVLCKLISGNPGYATLNWRLNESGILIIGYFFIFMLLIAERYYKPIRLSKIIAESPEIANLRGLNISRHSQLNGIIASLLTVVAAVYLIEHGGSYTIGLSGNRGFIALAIVGIIRHSGVKACIWAFVFGAGAKFIWESPFQNEFIEVIPFAVAILLLSMRGIQLKRLQRR